MSGLLKISDLFCTKGKKNILHAISFDVHAGKILAVAGPNGAGKSTLLKCLLGLEDYQGTISIDDTPLSELTVLDRAKLLTFVPQQTFLSSPLTVRQVVEQGRFAHETQSPFAKKTKTEIVESALHETHITDLAPRTFTNLSQGEKQKVLIARSIASQAKIFLLDEPTSSLDIGYALELFRILKKLASEGAAIVMVMHNLQDVLDWSDQTLVLSQGKRKYFGPTQQLLSTNLIENVYGVKTEPNAAIRFSPTNEQQPNSSENKNNKRSTP